MKEEGFAATHDETTHDETVWPHRCHHYQPFLGSMMKTVYLIFAGTDINQNHPSS
jgi:hypothetical protein